MPKKRGKTYRIVLCGQRGHLMANAFLPAFDFQLSRLQEKGYPLVLHGHWLDCALPFVDVDNVGSVHKAVSYLMGWGHCRIGLIANAPLSYTVAQDRQTGYSQASQEAELSLDGLVHYTGFSPKSDRRAMESLPVIRSPPGAVQSIMRCNSAAKRDGPLDLSNLWSSHKQ